MYLGVFLVVCVYALVLCCLHALFERGSVTFCNVHVTVLPVKEVEKGCFADKCNRFSQARVSRFKPVFYHSGLNVLLLAAALATLQAFSLVIFLRVFHF